MSKENVTKITTKESVINEAKAEVTREVAQKLKDEYKRKLRELESARRVVRNITREIEDLELRIEHELSE